MSFRICCDIDGVLADIRTYVRRYLPHDWHSYFEESCSAEPVKETMLMLRKLSADPNTLVYLVTGRPESQRERTLRWLDVNSVWFTELRMRPDGDKSSSAELKGKWYTDLRPDLVIDDDPFVVRAARLAGYTVLQIVGYRVDGNSPDMIP